MGVILTKIIQEVLPPSAVRLNVSHMLPLTQPARTMLLETYASAFQQSSINIKAIHKFEHLLNVAGPKWLCDQLVRVGTFVYLSFFSYLELLHLFKSHSSGIS